MFVRLLALTFTALSLSACAIGPLVSHETARTVGDSNHELIAGYGNPGGVLKYSYGITKDWDFGIHWESLSAGIRTKYAFVNSTSGWSWAGALGTGASLGGSHNYADVIGSYAAGAAEYSGTVRVVHVKTDPIEFKDEDTGNVDFTVNIGSYTYGQFILGTRYWFDEHWLVSAELATLFSMTDGLEIGSGAIIGAAFGYRF